MPNILDHQPFHGIFGSLLNPRHIQSNFFNLALLGPGHCQATEITHIKNPDVNIVEQSRVTKFYNSLAKGKTKLTTANKTIIPSKQGFFLLDATQILEKSPRPKDYILTILNASRYKKCARQYVSPKYSVIDGCCKKSYILCGANLVNAQ